MTKCPTCKLEMESHSNTELIECCMNQVDNNFSEDQKGMCLNCKHKLNDHSEKELAECTIAFLKSGIN